MNVTYGDLFDHLKRALSHQSCDHTLSHTKEFAERHSLSFDELAQFLNGFGGYCDCEVLLNVCVLCRINEDESIGQEMFTTPRMYAIEHDLYCHCRITGGPVCWTEAVAAKQAGVSNVEFWKQCNAGDPFAEPDSKRAILGMQQDREGGKGE